MKPKHLNNKDIFISIIFIITFITIYLFLTRNNHIFASTIDFKHQHYLIPEYLRTLFYSTHNLFPDFALNLGSGQNIYYLSYYGLLNPYILISYLFPHIKMINYLITTNCLIVIISTILFYLFLRKNHNQKVSFLTAFLFLTSGPLIFHAKRHIMFINYFPFLILGLFGIDNYLEKNKSLLLTISISLIILSSYYFSIPSLIALYIYSIYKHLKKTKTTNLKKITKHTINLIFPFLTGILITAILLLPTAYIIINGRTKTNVHIILKDLITPSLLKNLLYSPYSIGLTLITLIALIYHLFKGSKETKYLSITCLLLTTFPIFNYLLNGTLYINAKSLIPLIPLILILTANFLDKYFRTKLNKKQLLLISYLIISSLTICLITNNNDKLMTKDEITNTSQTTITNLINYITKKDKTYYRINTIPEQDNINKITNIKELKSTIYSSTSNKNYLNTYNKILNNPIPNRNKFMISSSTNLLSQIILGEKYIITKETLSTGYKLIKSENNINLYENLNTLPLGYATNKTISKEQFHNLTYPNNTIALLNNIIINNKAPKEISTLKETKLDYNITSASNVIITKVNNITTIKAKENATISLNIKNNLENKILFLSFHNQNNPRKDLSITINNTQNKLTSRKWKYFNNNTIFHYTIISPKQLDINLTKGTYILDNIQTYILDYDTIKEVAKNKDTFIINQKSTKGDKIIGTINVTKKNSYFTISIPYDKGFNIKVDNKLTNYTKSGNNFITFPIKKGKHKINITYQAPLKKEATIISLIGITILLLKIKKEKNIK